MSFEANAPPPKAGRCAFVPAHAAGDKVPAAYRGGDLFESRLERLCLSFVPSRAQSPMSVISGPVTLRSRRPAAMVEFQPTGQTKIILRPPCPRCGTNMMLARIEPDEPGHDRRIFECPRCDHEELVVVKFR